MSRLLQGHIGSIMLLYILFIALGCIISVNAQIPVDNLFSLKSLRSTYCLDFDGGNNAETVACTTLPEQTWSMGTNGVMISNNGGSCLAQNAGNVEVTTCNTADPNQQWAPQYQSAQSNRIIQVVNVGNGQCLHASGAGIGSNVNTAACTASPDDSWTRVDRGALTFGTIVDGSASRQWDIKDGGSTIVFRLIQDRFVATIGDNNAITTEFISRLVSLQSEATGWNALVAPLLDHTHVVRTDDTTVTVTLPAVPGYVLTNSEYVDTWVPSSALVSGKTELQSAPRPIIFNADCLEVPGIRFSTRDWTVKDCPAGGPESWWIDEFNALPVGGAGFCNELITGLNTLNSQGTCGGGNSDLAYKFSLTFQPLVAGDWYFRVGSDFGRGAAFFLDDAGVNFRCDDMWWATSWASAAVFYSDAMTVTRDRSYRMDLIGLENCCDGAMVVQYRLGTGGTWTDASVAELQTDTGVTSCGCWTNCTQCTADPSCGWCADGNCDNSDSGPTNRDPTLGQCVSGTNAGPEIGNCTRWLFGDCRNTPEVVLIQALDSDDRDAVYSNGDFIILGFDNSTNAPDLDTRAKIDNLLFFSEYIGDDYTGVWLNASFLQVTVLDIGTANPQIGVMTVTVLNNLPPILTDQSGCGFPTTSTAGTVLIGSWGDPARLNITKQANVTQADGADPISFNMRLHHKPNTGTFAYNITVTDIMPPHIVLIPGTVQATSGSSSFLNITRGNAASDDFVEVFLDELNVGEELVISFDALVLDSAILGDWVTNIGFVNHSALSPELGDEASSLPFLLNGNEVATITFVNTSLSESSASEYVGAAQDLSIGEVSFFQFHGELPEGTNNVTLYTEFPSYFEVTGAFVSRLGAGLSSATPMINIQNGGAVKTATVAFGQFTNAGDNVADSRDSFEVLIEAVVVDIGAATTGTAGVVTARLEQSQKEMTSTIPVDIVEPDLSLTVTANMSSMDPFATLGIQVAVQHSGSTHAGAYSVRINSTFLATNGLRLVPGSVISSQGTITLGNGGSDTEFQIDIPVLPDGQVATINFDAVLTSAASSTCSSACHPGCCPDVSHAADVTYASAPSGGLTTPRAYSGTASDSVSLTVPGPVITGLVANDPDDNDNYISAGDTLEVSFDVNTNENVALSNKASVDSLFSFSHAIGSDYTATWVNPALARITITTADRNVHNPPIGALTVTVRASAALRIQSGSGVVSTATSPPATGDWGLGAASAVVGGTLAYGNQQTDLNVLAGTETITISITGSRFEAAVTSDAAMQAALLNALVANTSDPFGWNNYLRNETLVTAAISLNGGGDVVTITIPARENYVITADEGITVTSLPNAILWAGFDITSITGSTAVTATRPVVSVRDVAQSDLYAGTDLFLTMWNAEWVDGAAFTSQRQAIIDGLVSPGATAHGWNYSTGIDALTVGNVTRINATTVRVSLSPQTSYINQGAEALEVSIPSSLINRDNPVVSGSFSIGPLAPRASLEGSGYPLSRQQDIRAGENEILIRLQHEHWIDGAAFDAQRQAILDNFIVTSGASSTGRGFLAAISNLTVADVERLSNTLVRVNVTELPELYIEAPENINVIVPAGAVYGASPVSAGNWTIGLGTVCGDGAIEVIEECDDSNTVSGDGCSSACVIEAGFSCPPGGGDCRTLECWTTLESHPVCCSLVVNDCPEFQALRPAT